jgi:putative membrane protein
MTDLLSDYYAWTKAFHIMSVISWMAGLFYLPRLFVYHAEQVETGTQTDRLFQTMEWKLYRFIMRPAMIATWLFGLALVFTPGIVDWSAIWPWAKGASVVAMTGFHGWLGQRRRAFAAGRNSLTGRQYRLMNEVPTLLMIIIVLAVFLKF